MKSNKKGFTLIELLAVIVILAIIALIATPIILNIVQKARKSAAEDSVYGIMKALELSYVESMLDTNMKNLPIVADFTAKKYYHSVDLKKNPTDSDYGTTFDLVYSGTAPTAGTITLNNKDENDKDAFIYSADGLTVNGFNCTIEPNKKVSCS